MIEPQIAIAAISAITAIVLAYIDLRKSLRETHQLVNSRMGELLELTRVSARAAGRLSAREGGDVAADLPSVIEHVQQAPDSFRIERGNQT